jgi:hypothetical protein
MMRATRPAKPTQVTIRSRCDDGFYIATTEFADQDRPMTFRIKTVAVAVLLGAISFVPRPAQAADPAKVEKLLTVLKVDRQMDSFKKLLEQSFAAGFADTAKKKGMTPAEIERVRSIVMDAMQKMMEQAFSWDYFKPQIVRIYGEELTNEEVDSAIAYYSSPQGQSLLAKMPVLMQRGGEVGMTRAREMAPQMDATMDAAIKQLREEESKEARAHVSDAVKQVHEAEAKDADAKPAAETGDKAKSEVQPVK